MQSSISLRIQLREPASQNGLRIKKEQTKNRIQTAMGNQQNTLGNNAWMRLLVCLQSFAKLKLYRQVWLIHSLDAAADGSFAACFREWKPLPPTSSPASVDLLRCAGPAGVIAAESDPQKVDTCVMNPYRIPFHPGGACGSPSLSRRKPEANNNNNNNNNSNVTPII